MYAQVLTTLMSECTQGAWVILILTNSILDLLFLPGGKTSKNQTDIYLQINHHHHHHQPCKTSSFLFLLRIHHDYLWSLSRSPYPFTIWICLGIWGKKFVFKIMMISSSGSFLFSEAVWNSSFSCVLKFHKRVPMQGLVEAIFQTQPLRPSSQHPNPMGIGLSWISESAYLIPPCWHGNSAYVCLVCKPSPVMYVFRNQFFHGFIHFISKWRIYRLTWQIAHSDTSKILLSAHTKARGISTYI